MRPFYALDGPTAGNAQFQKEERKMNANRGVVGRPVVLAMFCGLLFFGMSTFGYDVGDFSFEITNWETQEARLTGYNGTSSHVSIPSSFIYTDKYKDDDGEEHTRHITMTVTSIRNPVFKGNTTIVHVVIPNTIREVSAWYEGVFQDCTALEEIILPRNLREISYKTFSGCINLRSVDLSNVETIGSYAFTGCSSLSAIGSLDNATVIGSEAFSGCESLSCEINLMSIQVLGNAFSGTPIKKVATGKGLRDLSISAFSGCTKLEEAIIDGTFSEGSTVPYWCFQSCESLRRVAIIANLHFEERWEYRPITFSGCHNLEELVLGDSFEYIAASAFAELQNLKKVVFSSNMKSIHRNAFNGCSSLNEISFENVTSIGEFAFCNCRSLPKDLNLPNIVSLDYDVFEGCTSLETVTLGSHLHLTDRSTKMFMWCTALKSATIIGDGECALPNYTFYGCTNLETCVIGDGVSYIPPLEYHFCSPFEYCNNLRTVSLGRGITELPGGLFEELPSLETCDLSSVTNIGGSVFSNCGNLENVTSMENVESIGGSAFYNCRGLTGTVDLASIKTLSTYSFHGCDGLRAMKFGRNLSALDGWVFYGSTNLAAFVFEGLPPENVHFAAFAGVAKGAFGVYNNSDLEYTLKSQSPSKRLLSATPNVQWEDVISEDGMWNGLIMAVTKPVLTNDSYNVSAGSLHLNWENKRTTNALLDHGVTFEVRRGFTDSYDSAEVLTNGYNQLAYEDKQFDFTGGVSRIWYWVKPEHEYVEFEHSDACRTKNRYGIGVGTVDLGAFNDVELFKSVALSKGGFLNVRTGSDPRAQVVRNTISEDASRLTPGDIYVLYIATHGNLPWTPWTEPFLSMGGYTEYAASELEEDSNKISSRQARFIGVIMSCHSQAMIQDGRLVKESDSLECFCNASCGEGSNNLVAWITSSRKEEFSYTTSSKYTRFGEAFLEHGWQQGYAGVDLYIGGIQESIDSHNDGKITFLEMASYASKMAVGGFTDYGIVRSIDGESAVYIQNPNLLKNIEMGNVNQSHVSGNLNPPAVVYAEPILKSGKTYIRWSVVPGAERYRVYRYIDDPTKAKAINLDVVGTEIENENNILYHLFGYKCFVQAVNRAGISARSGCATAENDESMTFTRQNIDETLGHYGINTNIDNDDMSSVIDSDLDGDGVTVEREIIAGVSPFDASSKFIANITIDEDGKPKVTPNPDLGDRRVYTVYGKKTLDSAGESWEDMSMVSEDEQAEYHFFKIGVSLP